MRQTASLLILGVLLALCGQAVASDTYVINQTFGDIAFKVHHLGLFSSSGTFRQFSGQLTIDEAHPENTRVTVTIDTGSVAMAWQNAAAMLRSPPYFDVARYPDARFTSTRVVAEGPDSYDVDGLLQLRGVTRPLVLHAALVGKHPGPQPGEEIADFVVTGTLHRSRFGMVADATFISDRVDLRIDARVRLDALARAD
jgi:polyisoprenoid-binding protein YceI